MFVSFEGLRTLVDDNGYTLNRLKVEGVISDTAMRQIQNDDPQVIFKHIVAICEFFDVDVEDYIDTIRTR